VNPVWRGALLALLASALFGLSTPLVQRFGAGLGPFATAGLLYAGAALLGALLRQPVGREAQLRRGDVPRLLLMAAFGAVLGPVALAWGLQHTSGASASLMLTLEALFTAALARVLYRESLDARVRAAMALILCGDVLLVIDQGLSGRAGLAGLLEVLVATIAWGADNTVSRALAERDPGQVVMVKAALGASASGLLAVLAGETVPSWTAVVALLAVGASGYGLSLRFYLLAQRTFGAARTGSVFALAPFLGAVAAVALGDRQWGLGMVAGSGAMLAGVLLHLAESHAHEHTHEALEHEHAHRHDDLPLAGGELLLRHRLGMCLTVLHIMRHAHAHAPDAHHTHAH